MSPQLPDALKNLYSDVLSKLAKDLPAGTTRRLAALYEGILPTKTREVIKTAQKTHAFKEIFICAEVEGWKVSEEERPAKPKYTDPLVLGWDGRALWLIDAFDLTPVENYIKAEFTS